MKSRSAPSLVLNRVVLFLVQVKANACPLVKKLCKLRTVEQEFVGVAKLDKGFCDPMLEVRFEIEIYN